MRYLKGMHRDELAVTTRAVRTLHNVGWPVTYIAEALDLPEIKIKELIKFQIVY